MIDMTNAYRAGHGLSELAIDTRLVKAAQYHADYMARTGYYAHDTLDGKGLADRLHDVGYPFSVAAENIHLYDPAVRRTYGIDRTYTRSELASYFLDGWKASAPHNHNLLSKEAQDIGIALAQGRNGRIYAVQVFGDR